MSAELTLRPVLADVPSDAGLLCSVASLLAAVPGPVAGPRLSTLVEYVCTTYCPGDACTRAQRLELELADYLHEWRVLRESQVSPAGLDDWAAGVPIVFLRAAVAGCARCQGGVSVAPGGPMPTRDSEVVARKFGVTLDWSDPIHWDDDELADCRWCHTPTHGRDVHGRPFHESCLEELIAELTGGQSPIVAERFPTPAQQQARQGQTEVAR
jgi:hypothetical protein